jgi:hypothetical protein
MEFRNMTIWHSLYLPFDDNATRDLSGSHASPSIAETLKAELVAHGYTLFDPFAVLPGKSYPQAVRLFVAPVDDGWMRVIGEIDPVLRSLLLPPLSELAPCLLVELDGADMYVEAYLEGESAPPEIAFMTYAREHDCIRLALEGLIEVRKSPSVGGLPLDALPGNIQEMAGSIDGQQAEALFARMSGTLAQKAGGSEGSEAARAMLRQPDWNSSGGARISALMKCLRITGWRDPDFVTLRDAYALHIRRRRSPNATLYPGDSETLAAVPNALDYTPIYAGKA